MALERLSEYLKKITHTLPHGRRMEKAALTILKNAGVPPAFVRAAYRPRVLYIVATQSHVRSEIFLRERQLMEKLREMFGERAPKSMRLVNRIPKH
jgi:hypothetical protein